MLKYIVLLALGIFVITACQQKLPAEMVSLEKEVAKSPTNANITQLIDLYSVWLQEHQQKSALQKTILEKQLAVSTEHQKYAHAVSALQMLVIDYPDDTETADRILQLGDILTKSGKNVAAEVLYRSFLSKYPKHAQAADLAAKYPASEPVDSTIMNIGRQIFGDSLNTINEAAARQYVDACEAYALVNQGSDAAVEYLHKASETARTLRSTAKALSIYDWILRAYPDHARSAQAMFLKGFTYDNDLKDFENAKVVYTEFLQKYPNNEFASSAQFLLENLGKSDDELLEALQKKAAETSK